MLHCAPGPGRAADWAVTQELVLNFVTPSLSDTTAYMDFRQLQIHSLSAYIFAGSTALGYHNDKAHVAVTGKPAFATA